MKTSRYVVSIALLLTFLFLQNCNWPPEKKCEMAFSGKIVDSRGKPVRGASIEIGGTKTERKKVTSGENGEFRICVDRAERYVLNMTHLGSGFVSKIYNDTTSSIVVRMTDATVAEALDASNVIRLTDTTPREHPEGRSRPATPDPGAMASPIDTIPFVMDHTGRLIGFKAPQSVIDTYQAIEDFEPQTTGATIEVEADALEDDPDTRQGAFFQKSDRNIVTGSISTVDIYSPDGMPGNYSTRTRENAPGFMVTYGAADVNFYKEGKSLQLKKGKSARLTIPVDTLAIIFGEKLKDSIPLLVYDKNTGLWAQDGKKYGRLNKERTAYVATVTHFSVFNMDEEFTAGIATCYELCSSGALPAGSYPNGARIQITGVIAGHTKDLPFATSTCTSADCNSGELAYAINNMKPNDGIGLRLFNGNTNRVISSYVLVTENNGHNVNTCADDYSQCGGPIHISWDTPPGYMISDGTMSRPVVAVQKMNATTMRISWVYILGPPPTFVNPATHYTVEWSTETDNFTTTTGTGSTAGGIPLSQPPVGGAAFSSTVWVNMVNITIPASPGSGNFPDPNPNTKYIFRIRVGDLPATGTTIYSDPSDPIKPF